MDKLEFNNKDLQEQVQYVNDQLSTGLSVTNVCTNIGIDRSTVRKRFNRGGYVFNKDLNLYEVDINKIAYISNKNHPKTLENSNNTNSLEDRVKALESQLGALQQIVFNNQTNTANINRIELELLDFNADTVTRAYRLYENVQKDFKIFCKKHSEYKVQDIISTALVEFMNKRK